MPSEPTLTPAERAAVEAAMDYAARAFYGLRSQREHARAELTALVARLVAARAEDSARLDFLCTQAVLNGFVVPPTGVALLIGDRVSFGGDTGATLREAIDAARAGGTDVHE